MPATGTAATRLIVLRGNSGSGKSTTAQALRARTVGNCAWVEQDYLRRIVLADSDVPGGANIGLISQTVRYALDCGYDVILEGIFDASRYVEMLRNLASDHLGETYFYYFAASFEETVRRHQTRAKSVDFGPEEMRSWYHADDFLPFAREHQIRGDTALQEIVVRILSESGLASGVR